MIRALLFRLLIAALCLLPSQSQSYWQSVSQQNAGEPDFSNTDNACLSSSGTVQTFTAKKLGGAKTGRILAVTVNWGDSTLAGTAEITGVTVDGNAMARAVRAVGDNQNSNSEVWYAQVSNGSTGDVVVTSSTAVDGMTIAIYRLTNFAINPNLTAAGTTTASTGTLITGMATLGVASRRTNVSTSLSNMVNDYSVACGASLWGVHASQTDSSGTLSTTISPTTSTPLIVMATWTPATPCGNPNWASVLFQSGYEGTNGQVTPFPDNTGQWTLTRGSGGSLSSTRAEYGNTSAFAPNTTGSWATGTSGNFNLSTANGDAFTWEFSINYVNAVGTYDVMAITGAGGINTWMRINDTGEVRYLGSKLGAGFTVDLTTTSAGITTTNTWYKVTVEKNTSGVVRIYVGGTMRLKNTPIDSSLFASSTLTLVTNGGGNNAPQETYIDNVRITKGVALYDSDAGYTPATAAFSICGSWLFERDLNPANDNTPMWLNKVA